MNTLSPAEIWLIVALLFCLIEIFTLGFAVICFSVGALFAAIAAGFSLGLTWQIIAFIVGTVLAFVFARPFLMKYFYKSKEDQIRTNVDALIGRRVMVSEMIDNSQGGGRVAVDGDSWKAVSEESDVIDKGSWVKIVSRESLILTVKK